MSVAEQIAGGLVLLVTAPLALLVTAWAVRGRR
jgi:hypothetical protein